MHGSGATNQDTEMALTPENIQTLIDTATRDLAGRVTELERVIGESRTEATSIVTRLGAQEQATVSLTAMMDGQTQKLNGHTKRTKDSTEMKAIYNLPVFSGKSGEPFRDWAVKVKEVVEAAYPGARDILQHLEWTKKDKWTR